MPKTTKGRQGLSISRHRELGLQIKRQKQELNKISVEIDDYPADKKRHIDRSIDKILVQLDILRSELEELMFDDKVPGADLCVYYGPFDGGAA